MPQRTSPTIPVALDQIAETFPPSDRMPHLAAKFQKLKIGRKWLLQPIHSAALLQLPTPLAGIAPPPPMLQE
jgi:hypothetical protein